MYEWSSKFQTKEVGTNQAHSLTFPEKNSITGRTLPRYSIFKVFSKNLHQIEEVDYATFRRS